MANKQARNRLYRVLGAILCALPVAVFAEPAHITAAEVVTKPESVQIIFTLTDPHQCDVFALDGPHRVVVDLEDGRLKTNIKQLDVPRYLIRNVRVGTPDSGVLRIVFDMTVAATVKSELTMDEDKQNGKLVVDIYPHGMPVLKPVASVEKITPKPVEAPRDVEVIERSQAAVPQKVKMVEAEPEKIAPPAKAIIAEHKKIEHAEKKSAAAIDHSLDHRFYTFESHPATAKLHIPRLDAPKAHQIVVVIDAGHGGKDSGTVGRRGTEEKNVVLGIALRLAELVNEEPGMRAVLTRKGDYFVPLDDRLAISRNDKADLFIAIHADSYFDNHSTGASVFALSPHGASSVAAKWLAERENHSELGGVDLNELGDKSYVLRSVLIDLAQTATISDSIKLGSDVLSGLETVTALHYPEVEQAPFMVLKSPDIPSVLVETGFLSNPREEERLREPTYRDKLARALMAGIRQYVASHPMMANNVNQAAQAETAVS